jgi:hypothetical protein
MNMILHDFPTAKVLSGNTLFDPKFKVDTLFFTEISAEADAKFKFTDSPPILGGATTKRPVSRASMLRRLRTSKLLSHFSGNKPPSPRC